MKRHQIKHLLILEDSRKAEQLFDSCEGYDKRVLSMQRKDTWLTPVDLGCTIAVMANQK